MSSKILIYRYLTVCFALLLQKSFVFGQSSNNNFVNAAIENKAEAHLSQPCQIYNHAGELVSFSRIWGFGIYNKDVNIDSLNLYISQEIQTALYKTLVLSPFKDYFLSDFIINLKNGYILEKSFIFTNYKNETTLWGVQESSKYDNFYANFLANLNLTQTKDALKGFEKVSIPISIALDTQILMLDLQCKDGFVHTKIARNNLLMKGKTALTATKNFFSSKEQLRFNLSNPFCFSFLSCNGNLDCELEKFDMASKAWSTYYTIKNHEDCSNSLSLEIVNDSLINFISFSQAPGLYRAVTKSSSKLISNNPNVKTQELRFYSEPFYIDDFIEVSNLPSFEKIDSTCKKMPFHYFENGKLKRKNNFYFSNQHFIKAIDSLPYLNELLERMEMKKIGNLSIPQPAYKKDPYLSFQPIVANLVQDPFDKMQDYPHYFSFIGNSILVNGRSAVLKNEIEVSLSRRAERNPQLLQRFLTENNLNIVAFSLQEFITRIKPNDPHLITTKKTKMFRGKPRAAILSVNTNNPIVIMDVAKKMKKVGLFNKLSNSILYLD